MAYIDPTPADLKARYPAFATVDDTVVTYWLTDAHRFVDQSWAEADYAPALIAVAAHNMVKNGIAGITLSKVEGLAAKGVTGFKSGTFSAQLSEELAARVSAGGWGSTKYGEEYEALLRRNKPAMGVTGAGCVPMSCGFNGYAGPLPPYGRC